MKNFVKKIFWLEDYAVFMVLKDINKNQSWVNWDPQKKLRSNAHYNDKKKESERFKKLKYCNICFFSMEKVKKVCE